jgi:hypothetical protein
MATDQDEISSAIKSRDHLARRLRSLESPEERLARFAQLQRRLFDLLRASPDGFQHFFRRNLQSRRVEVIHGEWRPVSPDRRPYQA